MLPLEARVASHNASSVIWKRMMLNQWQCQIIFTVSMQHLRFLIKLLKIYQVWTCTRSWMHIVKNTWSFNLQHLFIYFISWWWSFEKQSLLSLLCKYFVIFAIKQKQNRQTNKTCLHYLNICNLKIWFTTEYWSEVVFYFLFVIRTSRKRQISNIKFTERYNVILHF